MATAQAPQKVSQGSVQYWPIKVFSAFGTINTLDGLDLRFDLFFVNEDGDDISIILNGAAANDGMIALPLIDSGVLAEGLYKVFISFVSSPQTPRLGPFYFRVDD